MTARDAVSTRSESMAVFNAPSSDYVIEVVRSDADEGSMPVRGTLVIRVAGATRTVPFTLSGTRVEVAAAKIYYTSRLVPVTEW